MTKFHAAWIAVLAHFLISHPAAISQEAPREPVDYRTENYRAPTPATLAGARVVTTVDAEKMWRDKTAIFVDVMPRAPRPANLPEGTIWRDKPRMNIPGSIWLPDTGYGETPPGITEYFRSGLARATHDDHTQLLLFYCLRDCWMSWNAAKRALALGYSNVAWYPDGVDGWTDMLLPVADAQPAPAKAN